MKIYLEDAIFNSMVMDFSILALSQLALREKIPILKTLFCSLLGSVVSIFLSFLSLEFVFGIAIKLLLGIIMCAIVVKKFDFKNLFIFFLVFLTITFVLGGFCFFVIYLFEGKITDIYSLFLNSKIYIGLIVCLVFLYILLLFNLIKYFYKKQKIENFTFFLKIKANDKVVKIKAFLDTGNILVDEKTNLPIIVVSLDIFLKIYRGKVSICDLIAGSVKHKIEGRYISYNNISSSGQVFIFSPQEIVLCGEGGRRKIDALLGVGFAKTFASNNCEALLSPLCI